MKRIINSLLIIIAVILTAALGSCGSIDDKINESTATLNAQISGLEAEITRLSGEISDLNGQLTALEAENETLGDTNSELESDKTALEAEKAALEAAKKAISDLKTAIEAEKSQLEAEKAELEKTLIETQKELRCTAGIHFWDGESPVEYTWGIDNSDCLASYTCDRCGKAATISAIKITFDQYDTYTADFDGYVPNDSVKIPVFTEVSVNSDSAGYDTVTNTFTISEDNPLVLTFTGENFELITDENIHAVLVKRQGGLTILDQIGTSSEGIITKTNTSITVTVDYDSSERIFNNYDYLNGFSIYDYSLGFIYPSSEIDVTVVMKSAEPELEVDSEGYTLVSSAEELSKAIENGGKIRLLADIVSATGFNVNKEAVIDLAGYDIKVAGNGESSFYCHASLTLTDSAHGSVLFRPVTINAGTLTLGGAIFFDYANNAINLYTTLDLSGYTGEELSVYLYSTAEALILPEGYSMYSEHEELLPDFDSAKDSGFVYVRPTESVDPGTEPEIGGDSEGYTLVSSAEELLKAIENGGKIRLLADIESVTGFDVNEETVIDLAGYDIKVTGEGEGTFYCHTSLTLTDSAHGSVLFRPVTINAGTLTLSGAIFFDYIYNAIELYTTLDLSGYTGEELFVYVYPTAEALILPEGYSIYSELGLLLPDFDSAKDYGLVYVRPTESADPGTEPDVSQDPIVPPEFEFPKKPYSTTAQTNIPADEIRAMFPTRLEMKYENGKAMIKDFGCYKVESVASYPVKQFTLVDGWWVLEVSEAEYEDSVRYINTYGEDRRWKLYFNHGNANGWIEVISGADTVRVAVLDDSLEVIYYIGDVIYRDLYSDGELKTHMTSVFNDDGCMIEAEYDAQGTLLGSMFYFEDFAYYYYPDKGWFDMENNATDAPTGYADMTTEDLMALCPYGSF